MTSQDKLDAIIAAIAQAARDQWGDAWEVELIRSYCRIESAEKGEPVTPKNRRTMLLRALETRSCGAETLLRLAAAAGIGIEMRRSL